MDTLDIDKLLTFVAIVKEGSFTKAAERLTLTQPTVSQQLASLEKSLGVDLIIRQPRNLKLTEAGETLLSYAERILSLTREAVQSTLETAGRARRTLRLGVGHTLAIYLLPELLQELRRQQPNLEIRIQTGNTGDLLAATADGQVELSLIGSPMVSTQLEITPFMQDELIIIVSPNDPWADEKSVGMKDLRERILLTRESGSALHAAVRDLLGADHLNSSMVITLGETEAIKRSVEADLGYALIQGIAVQRELSQGTLLTVPLAKLTTTRTYNIAQRRGYPLSPIGQMFVELLQSHQFVR